MHNVTIEYYRILQHTRDILASKRTLSASISSVEPLKVMSLATQIFKA